MGALLITRRELSSYLLSATGWLVLGVVLLAQGLLFNAIAMSGERKSFDVLQLFFYFSSGTTMVASIFISMRVFAEEKQLGTMVLLETSPVSEVQIVLGKFLGAWLFLCLLLAMSLYMPLLVLVNGKVTVGICSRDILGSSCSVPHASPSACSRHRSRRTKCSPPSWPAPPSSRCCSRTCWRRRSRAPWATWSVTSICSTNITAPSRVER